MVNFAPRATIAKQVSGDGTSVTVLLTSPWDPSSADTAAGFHYSFSDNYNTLKTSYAAATDPSSKSFQFETPGSHQIYGRIFDKDNGSRDYNTTVYQADLAVVAVSPTQINLTWSDTISGETGWRVQWDTDSSFANAQYTNLIGNHDHFDLTGLQPATRYYIRVRSYANPGSAADTIYSPKKDATTAPATPANVIASNVEESDDITITWSKVQGASGYIIRRYDGDAPISPGTLQTTVTVGDVATYTFPDTTDGELYQFTIEAISADPNSPNSTPSLPVENRHEPTWNWTKVFDHSNPLDVPPYVTSEWNPNPPWMQGEDTLTLTVENLPRHTFAQIGMRLAGSVEYEA
jgi:hypothetical protein